MFIRKNFKYSILNALCITFHFAQQLLAFYNLMSLLCLLRWNSSLLIYTAPITLKTYPCSHLLRLPFSFPPPLLLRCLLLLFNNCTELPIISTDYSVCWYCICTISAILTSTSLLKCSMVIKLHFFMSIEGSLLCPVVCWRKSYSKGFGL